MTVLALSLLTTCQYPANGQEVRKTLEGYKHSVDFLALSPNGKLLALAQGSGPLEIWDIEKGKVAARFEEDVFKISLRCVTFSPDGKTLAVSGSSKSAVVYLIDIPTSKIRLTIKDLPEHAASAVTFSSDSKMLIVAGWDHSATLYDAANGKELEKLEEHKMVSALALSPDGKILVTASGGEGTVMFWDFEKRRMEHSAVGNDKYVHSIVFSHDGKAVATSGDDKKVLLWDTARGRMKKKIDLQEARISSIAQMAFLPDDQTLVIVGGKATPIFWDIAKEEDTFPNTDGHRAGIHAVVISPDGKTLVTASDDKTVKFWDLPSKKK
jgi:WD40 repeat protein